MISCFEICGQRSINDLTASLMKCPRDPISRVMYTTEKPLSSRSSTRGAYWTSFLRRASEKPVGELLQIVSSSK